MPCFSVARLMALALLLGATALPAVTLAQPPRSMLDMTFREFETAIAKTDIVLLPVGAIEEHGPYLPLDADAIGAMGQLGEVQAYLRDRGVETIIGPSLNIGITNEGGDRNRDGTYIYPGSLTIGSDTFVALYVDVLKSLHDNGVKGVFLYSGHLGARHLEAMARAAEEANRVLPEFHAYALIDSERLQRLKVNPGAHILAVDKGLNFEMLADLLGAGQEPDFVTHADGWETSLLLHFKPEVVRPGYTKLPHAPSKQFLSAIMSGDTSLNPDGVGGFPTNRASAEIGKTIAAYRTQKIGDAIMSTMKNSRE